MKELVYNHDNLLEFDVTEESIRLKVLLIHGDNIILGYERGIYQFPGGHLEEGESFNDCIKREILEEVGIEINDKDIGEPIYKIVYMNKDYPEIGKNRKSIAYYYVVNTIDTPDLSKTNYTAHELSGNFRLEEIPIDTVIERLNDNIKYNVKNKVIVPEMVNVILEYFRIRNKGDSLWK